MRTPVRHALFVATAGSARRFRGEKEKALTGTYTWKVVIRSQSVQEGQLMDYRDHRRCHLVMTLKYKGKDGTYK